VPLSFFDGALAREAFPATSRWLKEVWGAVLALPFLSRFMTLATLRSSWFQTAEKPPRTWRGVKGPASATWMELQRAGWSWLAPFAFTDAAGQTWDMLKLGPNVIVKQLAVDYQRKLTHQALPDLTLPDLALTKRTLNNMHLTELERTCVSKLACGGGLQHASPRQGGRKEHACFAGKQTPTSGTS